MTKRIYKMVLPVSSMIYFNRGSVSIAEKQILECRRLFNENKNLLLRISVPYTKNKTKSYKKEIKASEFLAGIQPKTSRYGYRERFYTYQF